ncbi:gamma-glutamylcyclotransferase family protein [Gynurincola endophyticus]|uniref:gamma-glutamylcyclotransferase family protein n=1 Tax=Gynurincola endophyticus TaxID=2479004 RepID=UPI000F8CCCB5|nr:gamma-glutamylcyclotransferase family protein [Gynurincola endophyticus]
MPDQSLYLFVYGSLRKGFQHEAYQYIRDNFSLIGEASVKGKLYNVGEYPGAIPCEEDRFIKGELYQAHSASAFKWAIAQLDDYEGLTVEKGETALFQRKLEVLTGEYATIKAWVYWYNLPYEHLPLIESGDYLTFTQQ